MTMWLWAIVMLGVVLVALVAHDLVQKRHAIIRNFPIIGHLRYLLERIGPELRQYIVTDNDSERPFSRDQRRWIYASAKREDNTFGFGTDNRFEAEDDYLVIRHAAFPLAEPLAPTSCLPTPNDACAKVLGRTHNRRLQFRPASIVNISGMSFGSLGAKAVESLNRGAAQSGCWQSTGEGGLSPHHLHGGDLVLQLGTAYFGCRTPEGQFDIERLVDLVQSAPVRAIEIKLSQGAKPGLGGLLPGKKVTPEIAKFRGIPVGKDCHSPPSHTAFTGVEGLCDFVETIAERTGLPVGIKSAVGEERIWHDLANVMVETGTGPDFVTIDGGEGGTGAAPYVFADHVALPFYAGFTQVYKAFAERGLQHDIVFIGSGRLGLPARGFAAMALGVDIIAVAREAMFAVGCIQAQKCHTGHCPTGVATQSKWLQHGLDPTSKSARVANYVTTMRYDLQRLAHASGNVHPALANPSHIGMLSGGYKFRDLTEVFGYRPGWGATAVDDLIADIGRNVPSNDAPHDPMKVRVATPVAIPASGTAVNISPTPMAD
jgi:glutamate synthase domain-containing protein 2